MNRTVTSDAVTSGTFTGDTGSTAAGTRTASGLRQGCSPAGRTSLSPVILAVRSTLRTQR